MPKYVKIKKAKNLRFRLISVLYLLFISLSIIQIPIEWLRINPYTAGYMRVVNSKGSVAPELLKARNTVNEVDSTFLSTVGFDEERNSIVEPSGYSAVDKFFINENNADIVFNALLGVKEYYSKKSSDDPKRKEFESLFEADLKNGLNSENKNIWREWKFKHVPSTVARTLLAELKLRLNLLNGAIELDSKKDEASSLIKLAFNVDLLQLGDTASFVVADKRNTEVIVTYNGANSNDYHWNNDTLRLVPKTTGTYKIDFTSDDITESLMVNVQPTNFIKEKGEAVQFFYEGKKSELKYQNLSKVGKLKCDCADESNTKYGNASVEFMPNKSGWCHLALMGVLGNTLVEDSVYVQELPTPLIFGSNVSSNRISRARLAQQGELRVTAKHPDMDNFNYNVVSMKVTLIGSEVQKLDIQGANIKLSPEEVEKLHYIEVNEINVRTEVKDFLITEPLIIETI